MSEVRITPVLMPEWFQTFGGRRIRRYEALLDSRVYDEVLRFGGEEYLFEFAASHSIVFSENELYDNTIYIYTDIPDSAIDNWKVRKCANCPFRHKKRKNFVLPISFEDVSHKVIFDRQTHKSVSIFCVKFKVIAFDGHKYVFASYCPRHNIMTISDITHAIPVWEEFKEKVLPLILEGAGELFNENRCKTMVKKEEKSEIYKDFLEGKFKVTVGVDAELEIFDGHRYVSATHFYDYSGEIGCDGAGSQLELRPKAGEPEKLVNNFKRLLERVDIEDNILRCWSDRLPLGAHIHVGVKYKDKWLNFVEFPRELKIILDTVVGKKFMKINEALYDVRLRRDYGWLGDLRQAEAHPGFEYRTPPSYWVHEPRFMKITAEIMKRTIELYFRNIGKEIRIPSDWTVDDYVNILGIEREDIEYWLSKIEKPELAVKEKDVREFWGIRINYGFKFRVIFGDDWLPENKRIVEAGLYSMVDRLNKEQMTGRITVYIFGLRSDRGDNVMFTNNIKIKKELEDRYSFIFDEELADKMRGRGTIVVGIPYRLRTQVNDEVEEELRRIVRAITNAIWEVAHGEWKRKFRSTKAI